MKRITYSGLQIQICKSLLIIWNTFPTFTLVRYGKVFQIETSWLSLYLCWDYTIHLVSIFMSKLQWPSFDLWIRHPRKKIRSVGDLLKWSQKLKTRGWLLSCSIALPKTRHVCIKNRIDEPTVLYYFVFHYSNITILL